MTVEIKTDRDRQIWDQGHEQGWNDCLYEWQQQDELRHRRCAWCDGPIPKWHDSSEGYYSQFCSDDCEAMEKRPATFWTSQT
jgi:hypothetical protein